MTTIRVGITGGRDYGRYDPTVPAKLAKKRKSEIKYIHRILDRFVRLNSWKGEIRFAGGDATGVDTVVRNWCIANGYRFKRFNANWKKFGNGAGPRRNKRVLDKFKPEVMISFPSTGTGTANMVKEARKRGILVYQQPGLMPNYAKKALDEKRNKKIGKVVSERERRSGNRKASGKKRRIGK